MPSLRRTFSYPPVRSSPYPTSSPSSALYNASRAQGGHGHRRSSGSDVSHRRVLADIEWWRVADGQRLDQGDDFHQVERDQDADHGGPASNEQPATATILSLDDWSSSWTSGSTLIIASLPEEPHTPPTDRFAELSIAPPTPESAFLPLEIPALGDDSGAPSHKRHRSVTMPVFPTKTKLFDDLLFNDFGNYADFSVSPLSSHLPLLLN
ncbi:hypothetical protein AX14_002650 [Amanita brunnescens Koide BX004]|nr:hypothetical protein AX14_002650 [Amanita brunnescens Koide BX004]